VTPESGLRSSNAGQPTGVRISSDPAEIDLDWLHPALSERAYWALGRSREVLSAAISGSLCFGAYVGDRQVAFARVITDEATFGWVCDVFVDEAERGKGIADRLVAAIVADARLHGLRLVLATRDAQGLYERHGFRSLVNPERWMERPRPTPAGGPESR
jgi:GNAT superfamily N-acetyltransferase